MQTTAINMQNPTTFSAKQRFLNKQQLSDMRTILQKMNKNIDSIKLIKSYSL